MADSWKPLQDRKWEASKMEADFIKLVEENGFAVVGIKEHTTQTNYKIGKDGIFQDYMIYHNGGVSAQSHFDTFMRFFNIRVEYEKLKAEYDQESNL